LIVIKPPRGWSRSTISAITSAINSGVITTANELG
jgi:hypothetical protein